MMLVMLYKNESIIGSIDLNCNAAPHFIPTQSYPRRLWLGSLRLGLAHMLRMLAVVAVALLAPCAHSGRCSWRLATMTI